MTRTTKYLRIIESQNGIHKKDAAQKFGGGAEAELKTLQQTGRVKVKNGKIFLL